MNSLIDASFIVLASGLVFLILRKVWKARALRAILNFIGFVLIVGIEMLSMGCGNKTARPSQAIDRRTGRPYNLFFGNAADSEKFSCTICSSCRMTDYCNRPPKNKKEQARLGKALKSLDGKLGKAEF